METMNQPEEFTNAGRELTFQNEEKIKWTDELVIAYRELVFQKEEQEKRVAELIVFN